jgi:F0F1-type ATP synthase epsilon subunit
MNEFHLKIATPEKKLFDGDVVYCEITTTEGKMGIKARHEPFLAVLKDSSPILYRTKTGLENSIEVYNAILTFKDNSCVLTMA